MAIVTKKIGPISAYAIAKEEGYTGTKEQFAQEIGNAAANAQAAAASATAADRYATSDATSASNAMSTTPAGYNSMMASIAAEYDATATYAVGDYCRYNSEVYRCVTAISAAEAFDSTKWTKVTIGGQLSQLSEDISISIDNAITVNSGSDGYVQYDTGAIKSSTTYKVTDFIEVVPGSKIHIVNSRRTGNVGSCFYFSNQLFHSTVEQTSGATETTVVVPKYAKYIRISYTKLPLIKCIDLTNKIIDNSIPLENYKASVSHSFEVKDIDVDLYVFANSSAKVGWESGAMTKMNGNPSSSTNYIRSVGFFTFNAGTLSVQQLEAYKLDVFVYKSNGDYLTHYDAVESMDVYPELKYRFQIGNFSGQSDSFLNVSFLSTISVVFTGDFIISDDNSIVFEGAFPAPSGYTRISNAPESMCFISENMMLSGSASDKSNPAYLTLYTFSNFNSSPSDTKQVTHTLGHMNSIDYRNGALIFGDGGAGVWNNGDQQNPGIGKFYIINDFLTKFNSHYSSGTAFTLDEAIEISCNYFNFIGCSKFNVIFGEVDIERYRNRVHDIAYIVCADIGKTMYNTHIFRIQLGIGANQLNYGDLSAVGESEYNGTYNVVDAYNGISDGTDYANDMTFIDGNIYACIGENGVRVQKFVLDDMGKKIIKHERKQIMYNGDGSVVGTASSKRWSTGICCIGETVLMGFSNVGGIFAFDKNSFK